MTSQVLFINSDLSKQRGAAVLLTVVLLLIMVTLVTLYTGKIQSFEHRIAINEQNQQSADNAAQSGLSTSLAMLVINKVWPSSLVKGELAGSSHYQAQASSLNLTGGRELLSISATGYSADGLAQSILHEQALIYPLLINVPTAPLVVQGGLTLTHTFEIGLNPNGLGASLPLSVWSDLPLLLSSEQYTCYLSDFYANTCGANPYSHAAAKQNDIVDNSASFPADLLSYLFNLPAQHWQHVNELADLDLPDCSSLDVSSVGFIWVNGDCTISGNTQVAQETRPIVLVVFDGQFTLQPKVLLYGLVLVFKPPSSTKELDVSMQGQAMVQGVVVTNFKLGEQAGVVRVAYNASVLAGLQKNQHLRRVAKVPGSKRDF